MGYFGKFSQAKRTSKLLNIYTLLQKFIKLENGDGDSEKLTSLLALPDQTLNDERIKSLIRCLLIKQGIQDKSNLLNNQKSYLGLMADKLKVLGLGAERTELLRTALIDNTPISGVFTSLYEKYDEVLLKLKDAPLEEVSEIYTSRVLSGSAFNLNVFTMRQSHSRVYCQSRIVKEF